MSRFTSRCCDEVVVERGKTEMTRLALQRPELKKLQARAANMGKCEKDSMLLCGAWHYLADAVRRVLDLLKEKEE